MKNISFRDYVLSHSLEDSPAGDFIMDAKHPSAKMPDVQSWSELKAWLESRGARQPAVDSAQLVWKRYLKVKEPIPVELGTGLTVRELIELLKKQNPDAHVIKYNAKSGVTASRVLGFSKVTIINGSRNLPAIMLEG